MRLNSYAEEENRKKLRIKIKNKFSSRFNIMLLKNLEHVYCSHFLIKKLKLYFIFFWIFF